MKRNIRKIIKVVLAIIGVTAGISASIVFSKKYHNTNAAAWAGVSAAFALFFLYIIFSVSRDIQRKISPFRFVFYMFIGGIGAILGLSILVAYLVIGIKDKEPSVDPNGSFVVVVWGFMTFKWSLFSLMSARTYYKKYTATSENELIVSV